MDRASLMAAGMDVDGALERLLGNESLLDQLLDVFMSDQSFEKLERALDGGDVEGAAAAAHTLKGVAANLSMTRLQDVATRMLGDLRDGDLAAAQALRGELGDAYRAIRSACESH